MARQPDNILLTFENIDTLSGNNTLNYYYREGVIYVDGGENLLEFKRLALTNEQLSRTTRLADGNHTGQTYRTEDGNDINLLAGEELYVSHNYTGDLNLDKDFNPDSWWYDINWHKSYRVYLVVTSSNQQTVNGEVQKDYRIKETFTVYKGDQENDNDGTYTFLTKPEADVGITASVVLDKQYEGFVWETANLALYYNNSVIADKELDLTTVTLPERMTLLVDYAQDAIEPNDQLKMSVSVTDAPPLHDDALLVTEYTMSISSESDVDAPETILGFNENLGLNRDFDCQPTLNNSIISRQSKFIQDVDYSISSDGLGISTPQNLSLLLSNRATKATVPDSNYSQYSQIIPKYYGTKTNRTGVNESGSISFNSGLVNNSSNPDFPLSPFYFTTDNLGSFPNVESRNSYIGYFEKIIDPYPVLNGKTAYFVKYLIDENTDVLDPSITVQGLNNLKNTFKLKDVNNLPTSVKASVQNIDEARELKDLENFSTVFKTAVYPTPILYSQTSSNAYSNEIILSGSGGQYLVEFDMNTEGYRNLAFTAEGTVVEGGEGLTALGNNADFVSFPNINYIALPNEKVFENPGFIRVEEDPTDQYTLTVNYNFYTTHFIPHLHRNSWTDRNDRNKTKLEQVLWTKFGGFEFKGTKEVSSNPVRQPLKDVQVQLKAWNSPSLTPQPTNEGNVQVVNLQANKVYNEPDSTSNIDPLVEVFTNQGFKINFDSEQIYNALNTQNNPWPLWLRTRNAEKSYDNSPHIDNQYTDFNDTRDTETIDNLLDYEKGNYLEWNVSFKINTPDTGIYSIQRDGIIKLEDDPVSTSDLNAPFSDFYARTNFKRSFNPPGIDGSTKHFIGYDYRGLKTPSSEQLGVSSAPYWKHLPNSTEYNKIYLVSRLLNTNYNKSYFQAKLEYNPGPNTAFPFAEEPPFTQIPTPSDQWKVEIGDEIRFENLESKTYTITNIYTTPISDEAGQFERIVLTLDQPIISGTVLDFFLIRRYKSANNFVILNQQKPYGVPPSASSAPGILQTQYQNQELETNPDKVIINLIERNLI